jgi:hypothetical protein
VKTVRFLGIHGTEHIAQLLAEAFLQPNANGTEKSKLHFAVMQDAIRMELSL